MTAGVANGRTQRGGTAAGLRREVRRLRARIALLTPPLSVLLKRRGFTIYKKQPFLDVLLPPKRFTARYYSLLHKYSFRLFLRDVIRHPAGFNLNDVARYATETVTRGYLEELCGMRMAKKHADGYAIIRPPVTSFGPTLEWYVAELLAREFGAEAVWGVRFRRPRVGGDYDVIARCEGALLYAEVKSSPPKQIMDSEIAAFLDRVEDLAPETAVFLIDTELRMKDKLVPMFEAALRDRMPAPPPIVRMERELFRINDRIFLINAKGGLLQNIQCVLGWRYRHSAGTGRSRNGCTLTRVRPRR